jgi:hypothetical protein
MADLSTNCRSARRGNQVRKQAVEPVLSQLTPAPDGALAVTKPHAPALPHQRHPRTTTWARILTWVERSSSIAYAFAACNKT